MKTFIYLIFGGMIAIFGGIGISYVGALAVRSVFEPSKVPLAREIKAETTKTANDLASKVETKISGLKRIISFSAVEEEDLISAAAISLPSTDNKKITSKAYIIRNISKGKVVAEANQDTVLPIASLTKLVTAVIAKRNIDLDDKITISRDVISTYGNTAQFRQGEVIKANDLLYPLLMVSSNDAAEALAKYYGRSRFLREMNDFAQSVGAYRTYFSDPSGLSPANVSTAKDMAIILEWISSNEKDLLDITERKTKTVKGHTWVNPTHFLNWSNYMGGKNGYTPEADRTGAAIFALGKNKELYSVIVLGSKSRDTDVIKLLSKVE